VSRITALLGRNESGKSNLLLGLCTLNPVEGFVALNSTKDFPRHRRLTDCTDETPVVSSRWRLSPVEQEELIAMLPRASSVTHIEIGRSYAAKRWVSINLPPIEFNQTKVQGKVTKIVAAVSAAAERLEEAPRQALEAAATTFSTSAVVTRPELEWAKKALPAVAALRKAMAAANVEIPENQDALITEVEDLARTISTDEDVQAKAGNWAASKLPKFIYLAEYPELSGHQDVAQYMQRKAQNQLTQADKDFAKLCKVAGLDIDRLHRLQGEHKSEERNQLANRASAVVTQEIRKLWKDRALKIRFNLDASHFDTLISDPTSTYDVEVNLDERSRGFRWFFSFYITFDADTDGGTAKDAILLLDEPGLYLHIQSQKDLLAHWLTDFDNQIIYTTHSPFMVPVHALDWLRTVNINEATGTTVTNDPTGDARTLAPIRAALGYHYADTLFMAANNLIVEGVTDWWILEAASTHIVNAGRSALPPGMAVCPVDGAPKVPPMVSLLTGQKLNVLVLFDEETQARNVSKEMVMAKFIREENVNVRVPGFRGQTAAGCRHRRPYRSRRLRTTGARQLRDGTPGKKSTAEPKIAAHREAIRGCL
jgi:predicted ATP-dependent endonuclease of OLD family